MAAIIASAGAPAAVATFDAGVEGWFASAGAALWSGEGGSPGGFLVLAAPALGVSAVGSAAALFLGDQAHMLGGAVSFSARIVEGPPEAEIAPGTPFGLLVTITNGNINGGSATRVFSDALRLEGGWVSLSAPLTGAAWGVGEKEFGAILAGVTDLTIMLDAQGSNMPGAYGLDNFALVPTPGAGALLALAALAIFRRKR